MTTRSALWIPSVAIVVLSLRPLLFPGNDNMASRGVPLAVAIQSDRAVFDIEHAKGEAADEWLMVVGCLGQPLDEYSVHLSAEAIDECELKPFEPFHRIGNGKAPCRGPGDNTAERTRDDAERSSLAARKLTHGRFSDRHAERRRFSIHITDGSLADPRNYVTVVARPLAVGNRVRVFVDEQVATHEIAEGLLNQLISEFDHGVISQIESEYGTVSDVDNDGRFAVLLSPWLARLQGGAVSLRGFVRGSDFQRTRPAPFSNQSDLLYLNSNLTSGPELTALLAHEFTHAIICDRRSRSFSGDEDDWLNEGLAHLSETEFTESLSNLDHRVARFHHDPSRYPLVVRDYYSAGLWRDHGCRGATWSFLNWLQNGSRRDVIAALIDSDRSGIKNVEGVSGVGFAELFRDWSVSVFDPAEGTCLSSSVSGQRTRWCLSGPAVNHWDPQHDLSLTIRGTAFTGIRVSKPGRYRIRVSADCGAHLQVSLVPLVATHDLKVSASIDDSSEVMVTVTGAGIRRVTQLSFEDHAADRSRSINVRSPVVADHDAAGKDIHVYSVGSELGQRANELPALTVKAVVETTDGDRVVIRGCVQSNFATTIASRHFKVRTH